MIRGNQPGWEEKRERERERFAMKSHRTVLWKDDFANGCLSTIDQRKLPGEFVYVEMNKLDEACECISTMTVRGAPAIGAVGGFGMVLAAREVQSKSLEEQLVDLEAAKAKLDAARPTAVNLMWATARLLQVARTVKDPAQVGTTLWQEAQALAEQDVEINSRMAKHGAVVVPQGANILHHCNTGALATVDIGTALGVITECHKQGKGIHVWVDETRPRLQGARLTAWELMRDGVPMHLIADNAAGMLMLNGKVDIVLYGADRVAANGDVANKIGTYKISVCARENGIPVYAVVPTSTIDLEVKDGSGIPIEERSADEVTTVQGKRVAPENCKVFNPAFDVTPHRYVTGIITEEGICYPPYSLSLRAAKLKAQARIDAEK